MEPSAVIELLSMEVDQIDSAMEFWLGASFAVILAVHFTTNSLDQRFKLTIALLYVLVTAISVFRILGDISQMNYLTGQLADAGIELPNEFSGVAMGLRLTLYALGSAATLAYVFYPGRQSPE